MNTDDAYALALATRSHENALVSELSDELHRRLVAGERLEDRIALLESLVRAFATPNVQSGPFLTAEQHKALQGVLSGTQEEVGGVEAHRVEPERSEPCETWSAGFDNITYLCARPNGHYGLHQARSMWADSRGIIPTWSEEGPCMGDTAYVDLLW